MWIASKEVHLFPILVQQYRAVFSSSSFFLHILGVLAMCSSSMFGAVKRRMFEFLLGYGLRL